MITFLGFACLQLAYTISGKRSCDCLGNISVPAAIMLAADLGVAGLLVCSLLWASPVFRFTYVRASLVAAVMLGFVFLEVLAPEAKGALLASASGKPCYLNPVHVDLGVQTKENTVVTSLTMRNRADQPIVIVGITELPVVKLGDGLPRTVQPGGQETFSIRVIARGNPGKNVKPVTIYCVDNGRLVSTEAYLSWVIPEE